MNRPIGNRRTWRLLSSLFLILARLFHTWCERHRMEHQRRSRARHRFNFVRKWVFLVDTWSVASRSNNQFDHDYSAIYLLNWALVPDRKLMIYSLLFSISCHSSIWSKVKRCQADCLHWFVFVNDEKSILLPWQMLDHQEEQFFCV